MPDQKDARTHYADNIDEFFTQLGEPTHLHAEGQAADPTQQGQQDGSIPSPFPLCEGSDLQAIHEWILEERRRLEAYTRHQFSLIRKQGEELLAHRANIDENLIVRQQELNKQMTLLASRAIAVQKREFELNERDAHVSEQLQVLARSQEELHQLQEIKGKLRQDNESQQALLDHTRHETAQLQATAEQARLALASYEEDRAQRQKDLDAQAAELAERRGQLDQRLASVERGERGLQRRGEELDELESQLREESEQNEQQLARQRREVEEFRSRVEQQTQQESAAHQERLAQLQKEMDQVQEAVRIAHEEHAALEQMRAETDQVKETLETVRAELASLEAERKNQEQLLEAGQAELQQRRLQLDQRAAALEQQEKDLRKRSAEVEEMKAQARGEFEKEEQQLARERHDIEEFRARVEKQIQQETAAQHALMEELRAETNRLKQASEVARAELATANDPRLKGPPPAEVLPADLVAQRNQIEERLAAVAEAERKLQRREVELDEMEAQVRHDLHDRELQLAKEQREVKLLRARLVLQTQKTDASHHEEQPNEAVAKRLRREK